jgi:hypothetical protein
VVFVVLVEVAVGVSLNETATSTVVAAVTPTLETLRLWLAPRRVLTLAVKAVTEVKRSAVETAVVAVGSG